MEMFDIVTELRHRHANCTGKDLRITPIVGGTIFLQAADEIERLRAERDRLARRNTMLVNELSERGRVFSPEQLKCAIVKALYETEG